LAQREQRITSTRGWRYGEFEYEDDADDEEDMEESEEVEERE